MESIKNFFVNTIPNYFKEHPSYSGLSLAVVGLFIIIGCIRDWNWLMASDGSVFNMSWIINTFGRKAARIYIGLLGAVLVGCGILMYICYPHKS